MEGFDKAVEKFGLKCPSILAARDLTQQKLDELHSIFEQSQIESDHDADFVVCGSYARGEVTPKSDLDWFLLIDGPAKNSHFEMAKKIEKTLSENDLKEPGPTGVFGNLVFSHDLVHYIGGEVDTNQNMTRRILLLLESKSIPINRDDNSVRDAVLKAILERYLSEDSQFDPKADYTVPRFLLNDIVRLWRTMAVDYAAKYRTRQGDGWALRNMKLRFSRKLIFVGGMANCFSCHLNDLSDGAENEIALKYIDHLLSSSEQSPIDQLSKLILEFGDARIAKQILESYDHFLGVVGDGSKREELNNITPETKDDHQLFTEIRDQSKEYQTGLTSLFFQDAEVGNQLQELTQLYGVF